MTDRQLELDAAREREIADSEEGQAHIDAICKAMMNYWNFLEERGLIWAKDKDGDFVDGPPKCTALVAEMTVSDYGACSVWLKDGALERLYADLPRDDRGRLKQGH
jgi:hypothetical protein